MRRREHTWRCSTRAIGHAVVLATLPIAACTSTSDFSVSKIFPDSGSRAVARLVPRNGSATNGLATFVQRGDKVAVTVTAFNVGEGLHSVYIHQNGNCTSPNAASAGPVWNAADASNAGKRSGELPQLRAGTEGDGTLIAMVSDISVGTGRANDVVGHSVVVHAEIDRDPKPEFGVRNDWIACGVIARP